MSSIPAPGAYEERKFVSSIFSEEAAGKLVRVLTAVAAWLVVGTHLLLPSINLFNFYPNFYVSFATIIFCWRVCGRSIFTRTPIDIFFAIWLVLAVSSQVYASVYLNRTLGPGDITYYLQMILTIWAFYRAGYALTVVDAPTATGAILKATVFFLGLACLVGIAQGVGPFRSQAINFAERFGSRSQAVGAALELQSPRPIALYTGPNFFGFMNLLGTTVIIGFTMIRGRTMTPGAISLAILGLGIFIAGTVVAQSRAALAAIFLLVCFFLYLMLRIGQVKLFVAGIVAMLLAGVGVLSLASNLDLEYLGSTFERKLSDDGSFRARERGFSNLMEQAADLAPLGSGFTSKSMSLDRTGDKWARTNSIDNGYFQAFIAHGLPGVLHLLILFYGCFLAVKLSRNMEPRHIKLMRGCAIMMLVAYILYSVSGVRHAKTETAAYWMLVFGSLWASIHLEKARRARMARAQMVEQMEAQALPANGPSPEPQPL